VIEVFVDIGSGAAEGGCKHVIGKRLKQSGMIWSRAGSSVTLALRTAWLNGNWISYGCKSHWLHEKSTSNYKCTPYLDTRFLILPSTEFTLSIVEWAQGRLRSVKRDLFLLPSAFRPPSSGNGQLLGLTLGRIPLKCASDFGWLSRVVNRG